jgi:hypothetical protein
MKFDIVEVFTRAAKITWKYKILWLFGILASCGRSGGNSSNSGGNSNNSGAGDNPLSSEMMRQAEVFVRNIGSWFQQNTWVVFVLFAVAFIAIILQIFFTLVGTAGLARGVVKAENGAETLGLGELFGESLDYFWRLLGAALVIWLPFIIIFIAIVLAGLLPVINGGMNTDAMAGSSVLILLALCCCVFPISIALSLYHVQVKRSIIVENMSVFGALARGWQIFSQNIVPLIIVGIVLGIAGFMIGLVLALPVLLLVLPLMGLFIQGNITSWSPFIAVGAFLLCYSPIAWLLNGILTTYTESVWTLAYLRIITPKEIAPVMIEANA